MPSLRDQPPAAPTDLRAAVLPRTVWVVGIASLLTDFSSEMIYPLMPVFLSSVLGASVVELGLIEGIAEATASLLKIISGVWADRLKRRKPLVIAGYALSSLVRPMVGFANSWLTVLTIRFVDRIGKGIRSSPRDALIADSTHESQRGLAYGVHRAMDHTGAVIGPLAAAGLLLSPAIDLRKVFILSAIPGAAALAVLIWMLKESPRENRNRPHTIEIQDSKKPAIPVPTLDDWRSIPPQFRSFLLTLVIFTLGNSTDAFLLVRLSQSGLSAGSVASLWAIHHMVRVVSSWYGGKLSDRFGRRALIGTGWLYFAFIYLSFALVSSREGLIATFMLYGVHFGLVEPSERALVADLVPANRRGTAFGIFHLTVGLGALPASLLFGYVWKVWGHRAAFGLGAALSGLSALLLFSLVHPNKARPAV